MAANNLVSYDLKGVKESFANWVSNISPQDTPFVSLTNKEAISNKYFQWQTDSLQSAGANTHAEGEDAGDARQNVTTVLKNVTQILRKVVKVSDTADALSSYGRGTELQYQMEKATKEIKRDLEWTFLNQIDGQDIARPGTSNLNASLAATTPPAYTLGNDDSGVLNTGTRYTKGFTGLVAGLGDVSPEDADAIVHRNLATVGTITEEDVFAVTRGLYLAGAKPTHIMFHPKHAKFFSSLRENTAAGTRKLMFDGAVAQKINTYVNTIVDPLGQSFSLLPNRYMPLDKIYFFAPSDWTQMVLREPSRLQLAKNGSYERWMIEMEVGLRHRNPFASGILEVGTSTPPSPAPTVTAPTNTGFPQGVVGGVPAPAHPSARLYVTGGTQTQQITATPATSGDPLSYVSSNPAVATVSGSGLITAVAPGKTQIRVTTPGSAAQIVNVYVFANNTTKTHVFERVNGLTEGTVLPVTVGGILNGTAIAAIAADQNSITYKWFTGVDKASAVEYVGLTTGVVHITAPAGDNAIYVRVEATLTGATPVMIERETQFTVA